MEKIFDLVMNKNGLFVFNKSLYRIKTIKAIKVSEQPPSNVEQWNNYVDKIKKDIGVNTYCVFVWGENGLIGVMAFFDSKENEIKMKPFTKWEQLLVKMNLII